MAFLSAKSRRAAQVNPPAKVGAPIDPGPIDIGGARAAAALRLVDRILRPLGVGVDVVVAAALLAELGITFATAMSRALLGHEIIWAQEAGQLALLIMTFLGGAAAYQRGQHISIKVFARRGSAGTQVALASFVSHAVAFIMILTTVISVPLVAQGSSILSPILSIPQSWYTVTMVAGTVVIAVYALRDAFALWTKEWRCAAAGLGVVGVGVVAMLVLSLVATQALASAAVTIMLAMLVPLLFAGMPIAFVFVICGFLYVKASGVTALSTVALDLQNGSANVLLLAIPFFLLAGLLMTEGGLTEPLVTFVRATVGRLTGGLLQVVVVSVYLFSGLSGSKVADVAAVGAATKPMLEDSGYTREDLAAVLAASGAMAETIPPSVALLVYASLTPVSINSLFLAGLLPAGVLAVCVMALNWIRASRKRVPQEPRVGMGEVARAGVRATPALSVPVVLRGGISLGVGTPTEVSSFAVVYGFLVAIVVYRRLRPGAILRILVGAAALSGMILFLVGAADAFSQTLALTYVPHNIAAWISHIHTRWVFLAISVVTLLIMGSLLEGLPALLLFVPLLVGSLAPLGVDPVYYGIVVIIAMGIGSFLPPLGVGLYVATAISDTKVEATIRVMAPYVVMLVIGLSLVALVPEFTLALPRWLNAGM